MCSARVSDARCVVVTVAVAIALVGLMGCDHALAPPGVATAAPSASEQALIDEPPAQPEARPRPRPGAVLAMAPPVPLRVPAAGPSRAPAPLDLAADRPALPVLVPEPPFGGAAPFTFAGERRGWVARMPEPRQLPALAYGDGRIYVSGGFESFSFHALDAETGAIAWSSLNLADNGPTAPIFINGDVIFNTESCTLFALDAATGRTHWKRWLGDPTLSQPAVADGLIFTAHPGDGTGYRFSAFKVSNGSMRWSRSIDDEVLGAPAVDGDAIYVTSIRGTTYRYRRKDGKRAWKARVRATTSPWVAGGEVFTSKRIDGREVQLVLSAETGAVLRRHRDVATSKLTDTPRSLDSWKKVWAFEGARPVVADGVSYMALGGEIYASDARSGDVMWHRRYGPGVGKRSLGTVALAGPQVVVATRAGDVHGLDVDTGYTLWSYALDHAVVAQPIVANGWVYVTTKDGRVIGLQVADPSLDGWHMYGGGPHHNGPIRADG